MAYEVHYYYYEKIENSFEYNKEEKKSFKKVYGKVLEEYPLEKLAAQIQMQMARRDIFVIDIEIFEFQKKKITWRQNKSDLIIKNKRFSPNGSLLEELREDNFECPDGMCNLPPKQQHPNQQLVQPQQPLQPAVNIAPLLPNQVSIARKPSNVNVDKVIKKVAFMPGRITKPVGAFTPEKEYPVFSESFSKTGIGMIIETLDDQGRRVRVSDEHFVQTHQSLLGGEEIDFNAKSKNFVEDNRLNWNGVVKDTQPQMRG